MLKDPSPEKLSHLEAGVDLLNLSSSFQPVNRSPQAELEADFLHMNEKNGTQNVQTTDPPIGSNLVDISDNMEFGLPTPQAPPKVEISNNQGFDLLSDLNVFSTQSTQQAATFSGIADCKNQNDVFDPFRMQSSGSQVSVCVSNSALLIKYIEFIDICVVFRILYSVQQIQLLIRWRIITLPLISSR